MSSISHPNFKGIGRDENTGYLLVGTPIAGDLCLSDDMGSTSAGWLCLLGIVLCSCGPSSVAGSCDDILYAGAWSCVVMGRCDESKRESESCLLIVLSQRVPQLCPEC